MATKSGWYVATTSGSAEIDGKPFVFEKEKTHVRAGDPITKLKGWENMFAPVDDYYRPEVEQATAAPGEKRGKTPEDDMPSSYEDWTVDDLKAEASAREIEGRSDLTTKDDLVKALKKDDKA